MKTTHTLSLLAGVLTGFTLMAAEPPSGVATTSTNAAVPAVAATAAAAPALASPAGTNTVRASIEDEAAAVSAAAATNAVPTNAVPAVTVENGTNGLRINVHGAQLNLFLEYLSDAAGFIINMDTPVRGTAEVWSKTPVTKDEAVELLREVLRKNGYAVMRNGRILTITTIDSARTSYQLDVRNVSKPEDIESADETATWIIPVHYVNATQLMNNLVTLLPLSVTLGVNESANSLVTVAAGRDVRRILKIVNALDTSVATVSSIRVFPLHYADAKQLATEIQQLFTQTGGGGGGRGMGGAMQFLNMMRGGGPGGGFGGGMGGGGGSGGNPAGTKVSATSDDYSNSLVVNAAPEIMNTIEEMVKQIDVPTTDVTELRIFALKHADPGETADLLNSLFPDTSRNDPTGGAGFGIRFGGPGGLFGGGRGGNQATSTDRSKKKSQVFAVPDPRTQSILVSAASEMMPHIAEMIDKLDSVDARHEVVRVFELANADPQDVQNVLQDLFQRSGTIRQSSTANRSSMLGTQNPLTQRMTQTQNNSSSSASFSSGFGSSGGGGRGGM